MLLAEQVQDFLAHCKAKGLSPRTYRDAYGYPLQSVLIPFCDRERISTLADLDRRALDRLAGELYDRERPLSPASIKSYLKSVNQLLSWWEKETEIRQSRAPLPRLRKKVRQVLSRREIDAVEAAIPTERDRLIFRVLADTGAREGEVTRLKVQDLISRERTYFLKLRGKTGERMTPISPALYRRLKAYADGGRPRDTPSDRLFLGLRQRSGDYRPLTERGVYQVIRAAGDRASLGRGLYPHLLRHSAITWMVSRGMQPVAICDIVGCSLPVVMDVYTHLGDDQRFRAMMDLLQDDRDD